MRRSWRLLAALAMVVSGVPAEASTVASCGGFAPQDESCSVTFAHPGGALSVSVALGTPYVGRVDYTLQSATGSRAGGCFWIHAAEQGVLVCPQEERTGNFRAGQRLTLTGMTSFAAGEWEVLVTKP